MRRGILAALGVCLLAVLVFGAVKAFDDFNPDGRSPYEKLEDELDQERSEGKDTFPLQTPASKKRFVALYCLYMARSGDQLGRCAQRPAREVYRSNGNEYAWLFASETISYCVRGGAAGRFCDPTDVNGPVKRVTRLTCG